MTEKIVIFGEGGAKSSSTASLTQRQAAQRPGGATSMARDTAGTMLQSFEAIKEAVGLDIPRMLKDVSTGGLVGKASTSEDASMDGKDVDDMTADAAADNMSADEDL